MDNFPAQSLFNAVKQLTDTEHRLQSAMDQRGPAAPLQRNEQLLAQTILMGIAGDCEKLGLSASASRISDALLRLHDNVVGGPHRNLQLVHSDIGNVRNQLLRDLDRYRFFYLNETDQALFEQERPFGEGAFDAFQSARVDSTEAANCLALNRPKAAVFHCMAALEHGLRALATNVGVPFDRANWHDILNQIEKTLKGYRQNGVPGVSDKATRDEKMQRWSEAGTEFAYFKEAWRNYAVHGHDTYDLPRARSIYDHTRDFMGALSRWLHEIP